MIGDLVAGVSGNDGPVLVTIEVNLDGKKSPKTALASSAGQSGFPLRSHVSLLTPR